MRDPVTRSENCMSPTTRLSAPSPAAHRRGAAALAVSLLLALGLMVSIPGAAAASSAAKWQVMGPDATLTSDGQTAPAAFSYAVQDRTRKSAGWLFTSVATASGPLSLPWRWTGDHGRTQVTSKLTAGVYRDNQFQQIATPVNDGPRDCCADGSGFSYAGSITFDLVVGDRFGFLLTGSHTDKIADLRGTFTLAADPNGPRPQIVVPQEPVTTLIDATEPSRAVTFDVSASDPSDGPLTATCDPASGSSFPPGDTTVTCSATNSRGASSTETFIVRVWVDEPNLAWTTATTLGADDVVNGTLRLPGMGLWYRLPVQPDSIIQVDLTQLAADYDLTVFGDIGAAFNEALTPSDLNRLTAEFAADAFSPSAFSPSAFSPSAFSPSAFSPSAFSPSAFSPSAFSPSAFSADEIRDAYTGAQTRSLLTVSARDGLADENARVATWDTNGYFYLRVQGRNGAFAPQKPFRLEVATRTGACSAPLLEFQELESVTGVPGGARTVILTDSQRLEGVPLDELRSFAERPDIGGVVIDAGTVPRLQALNDQADEQAACPYAKNLVAEALRDIVNSYRDSTGSLAYVVLAGDDSVIPFFRTADTAGLGPEQNFVPPVREESSSQAALRRNQVLSQDAYGSAVTLRLKGASVAVPDVAVGRLIETPGEISAALERFVSLDGTLPTPERALVTGYDFLTDGADEVSSSFAAGLGNQGTVTDLITNGDVSPDLRTEGGQPTRDRSWTAPDLRKVFLENPVGQEPDLVYLAGHFSANSALAADYETSLLATEVRDSSADLTDTLVISAGCHSGFNIIDKHAVPGLTERLDWPQALVGKGAVLVGGTGYQYGDTDFVEYSERLYSGLADELRTGSGPVALGSALVAAKQDYFASTAVLSGIHQKALAEATLYGLPMLSLDLPSGRLPEPSVPTVTPEPVAAGPGSVLGLQRANVRADGATTLVTQEFTGGSGTGLDRFTYLRGPDGVTTAPGQPALPLQSIPVGADGFALRGVGFRGGSYTDTPGVVPLTGAPTTETHEVHTPFSSPVFFPRRLAVPNTYGAIAGDGGTRLLVTAAQHRSDSALTSTLRRFSATDFELFYSNNVQRYGDNVPALAAPPEITGVTSQVVGSRVDIGATVVGDPAAGIQQVWITRTGNTGAWFGEWRSVDLVQSPDDSTRWTGSLELPADQQAADVRFLVQAVNGVGGVSLDDNQGREYQPGKNPGLDPISGSEVASTLDLATTGTGVFGAQTAVTATLRSAGQPLSGGLVRIALGNLTRVVSSDSEGVAATTFPLVQQVGELDLSAAFDGDDRAAASTAGHTFTVTKRPTTLTLSGPEEPVLPDGDTGVVADLQTQDAGLTERSVIFVVRQEGEVIAAAARTTRPNGTAPLGALALPSGRFEVTAFFGSDEVEVLDGARAGSVDPENLPSVSEAVVLQVMEAPHIDTSSLPPATAGVAYDAPLDASGDPQPEVTVTGLPDGLTYADGRVRGTTTTAGTFPVEVTATNTVGTDQRTLDLTVLAGPVATIETVDGNHQSVPFGTSFEPLTARVADAFGNPVSGAVVTFTSNGSSTTAGTSPPSSEAESDSDGIATIVPRANDVVGAYDVVATTGTPDTTGATTRTTMGLTTSTVPSATFRLANAYAVSTFAAPLDQDEPVQVGANDLVKVRFTLSDRSGPINDSLALELATGCRVTFTSTDGETTLPAPGSRCVKYDPVTHRFVFVASGTLLKWRSGVEYELAVHVAGTQLGDVLGHRMVRVVVR
ncbi:MAG: Ig-like domain-containing protein [Nocardioides sp.]